MTDFIFIALALLTAITCILPQATRNRIIKAFAIFLGMTAFYLIAINLYLHLHQ